MRIRKKFDCFFEIKWFGFLITNESLENGQIEIIQTFSSSFSVFDVRTCTSGKRFCGMDSAKIVRRLSLCCCVNMLILLSWPDDLKKTRSTNKMSPFVIVLQLVSKQHDSIQEQKLLIDVV